MEDNPAVVTVEPCVVGLRFQPIGKIYHFDATNFKSVQKGDFVVVETSRGLSWGRLCSSSAAPTGSLRD